MRLPTNRDPKPTGGSWWLDKSREQFSAEIATRFALNKADKDSAGLAQWSKPVPKKDAA